MVLRGSLKGIDEMSSTKAPVLLSILKLINKYHLYSQVVYSKQCKQSDVCTVHCAFGCLLLSGHVGDFAVYCTLLGYLFHNNFHFFLLYCFDNCKLIY